MGKSIKIALVPNLTKTGAYEVTLSVIELLKNGAELLMTADLQTRFRAMELRFFTTAEAMVEFCDILLTIGGDGTIIHASKEAALYQKPLLGINMGRLGFVAGLEPNETDKLSRLLSGDYTTEKRMMLQVTHISQDIRQSYYALNDAVISHGSISRLIDIDVSMNNSPVCHYRADGLIISTPTGSSAYSLSAGGPVIEPTMSCLLMTPICSHALFARSVLFGSDSQIDVNVRCDDSDTLPCLTVDGDKPVALGNDDIVRVTSAKRMTELIVLNEKPIYKILKDKFTERGF